MRANGFKTIGESTEVLAAGFRQMEKDIWSISAKVLTSEQRGELRQLILLWRKNNPDKVVYNFLNKKLIEPQA